jgi:hypothetical protein
MSTKSKQQQMRQKWLRARRADQSVRSSQAALAKASGVDRAKLSQWQNQLVDLTPEELKAVGLALIELARRQCHGAMDAMSEAVSN